MDFQSLKNFYQNKTIFLTGHTGFKGAWLLCILKELGAKVHAYALAPEDVRGNMFNLLSLENKCEKSHIADIRNLETFEAAVKAANPDIVFHLAAQPFVLRSYEEPLDTINSNVLGTTHLFEIIRKNPGKIKTIVNITSDKCYENRETLEAYTEEDPFGGYDPYSASKGMCELLVNSYRRSFFNGMNISLVSCRAGNVVGGGDFGENRIIPDLIENIQKTQTLEMRSPNAIRPWQHELDVLYGYLLAGVYASQDKKYASGYNFAPLENDEIIVEELVKNMIKHLGQGAYKVEDENRHKHEAHYLKLNSQKAKSELGWQNKLDFDQTCSYTAAWYKAYLAGENLEQITHKQIQDYFSV